MKTWALGTFVSTTNRRSTQPTAARRANPASQTAEREKCRPVRAVIRCLRPASGVVFFERSAYQRHLIGSTSLANQDFRYRGGTRAVDGVGCVKVSAFVRGGLCWLLNPCNTRR